MHADSSVALKLLRVDGGMSGNDVAMQIQADVLGIDVGMLMPCPRNRRYSLTLLVASLSVVVVVQCVLL